MADDPKKLDATVSPGGTNTFIPAVGDKKRPYELDEAEAEFVSIEAVPIFDVHGDITLEDLETICVNNNTRIADTGDASPIIFGEGHTSDDPDGSDRPVAGFADNFRIGQIGNVKPRPAILVDFHIRADRYEESKEYPRRSVELWERAKFIDSIALLGGTTPARDLCLLFNKASSKSGVSEISRYELAEDARNMADDTAKNDDQDKFDRMLQNSASFKKFMAKFASDDEDEEADKHAADEQCDETDKMSKHSKMSMAEQLKAERDEARIELARFRRESEAGKAAVADVLKRLRKAERQDDLKQLSYEGYSIDLANEISEVVEMDDAAYARHLERIKKNYQRDPLNIPLIPQKAADRKDSESEVAHKERGDRARKFAMEHGCSYESALEQVK